MERWLWRAFCTYRAAGDPESLRSIKSDADHRYHASFVSYGGTSILFLMTEMGIALSVSGQIRTTEAEREEMMEVETEQ